MLLLKAYKHLEGYLERWTILCIGRFHVRIHVIKSEDKTPFLHSHPFSFLSFILSGGYTEELENGVIRKHKRFHVLIRSRKTYHRINSVLPNTKTLFFAWKSPKALQTWDLVDASTRPDWWIDHPAGVYVRTLYGKKRFCRFDRAWRVARDTIDDANREERYSIDQTTRPDSLTYHRVIEPAQPQYNHRPEEDRE